ncbi:MAG TPA: VWA domain-containing protein [Pyrinomonadaceae bacterium]|nr:VWA domain-containing protein [Pyrinomonadaceae bacterium]
MFVVAESQSSKTDSFFVRSNLLVTDGSKNNVYGLTKSDFTLYENDVVQPITYFAHRQGPLNVAILTDNSGSMRGQMKLISSFGKQIVSNLATGDEAQIIRFVGREAISVEQEWTAEKVKLSSAFDDQFLEGGQSAVTDAVYVAVEDIIKRYDKRKDARYAVVLFSDCEDRDSYYSAKQLIKLIGKRDIPIHVITQLGDFHRSEKVVQRIRILSNYFATRTGGSSFILASDAKKSEVQAALDSILLELRSPYVLGYVSTNLKLNENNPARTLRIFANDGPNGEKRSLNHKSYVAMPFDQTSIDN